MGLLILDHVVVRPMIDFGVCPSLVYGQPFRSGKSHDPAWSEVARPFAVYHMESNTSLFMASPDDTTVQRDWKPSSIYQLYGRRCEQRRPKIIVNIYLKVVGLKERKAQHILSINCTNIVYHFHLSLPPSNNVQLFSVVMFFILPVFILTG